MTIKRHRVLKGILLVIPMLLAACKGVADVRTVSYEKSDFGPSVDYRTGAVGSIRIPVATLENARVSAIDGLVFLFDDGSNFSLATLTDVKAGHIGVDMRTWPEYMLGLKTEGVEPDAYISDLLKSREHIITKRINPIEVRRFKTVEGMGYWSYGDQRSLIVLTSDRIKDQVAVIFTDRMSEQQIKKIIINGALK